MVLRNRDLLFLSDPEQKALKEWAGNAPAAVKEREGGDGESKEARGSSVQEKHGTSRFKMAGAEGARARAHTR